MVNDDTRLQVYRQVLDGETPPAFEPHFATRVVQRIQAEGSGWDAIYRSLRASFVRFAFASVAAAIAISVYSLAGAGDLAVYGSVLESILGLPTPSLDLVLRLVEV